MLGLAELARAEAALDERSIDHLQRLVAAWALPADLSFADLLLYAPCVESDGSGGSGRPGGSDGSGGSGGSGGSDGSVRLDRRSRRARAPNDWASAAAASETGARAAASGADQTGGSFVVLAHVRATTAPTVHVSDPVGTRVGGSHCEWLRTAMLDGVSGEAQIIERGSGPAVGDDDVVEEASLPLRDRRRVVSFVPVRSDGAPIAVLAREAALARIRHESPLESVYRGVYGTFAQMISDGTFPYDRVEQMGEFREPRVSDGVLLHDREGRITYASPNAVSALHRLGVIRSLTGSRLRDVGLDDTVIRRSFWRRRSTVAEFDSEPQTTVVLRAYPLIADGRVTGAVALLRDISELRHRDRLLVSKDATIREIHHRVKNNLQTVSSLLKLQVRRLANAEAKAAVESSVRRISSIAMVHEHLSLDTTSDVDFDGLVAPLLRMVEEGLAAAERPVAIQVDGTVGSIDGEVAMPLAVVLVELVQNALQHAAAIVAARPMAGPPAASAASAAAESSEMVQVRFGRTADMLTMSVTDSGPGVPDGFSLDRDAGLGLTIVRTFVVHHLGGTISIRAASARAPRGAVVDIAVPRRTATVPIG